MKAHWSSEAWIKRPEFDQGESVTARRVADKISVVYHSPAQLNLLTNKSRRALEVSVPTGVKART